MVRPVPHLSISQMKMNLSLAAGVLSLWISCSAFAAEQKAIFSGPQPGEKTTAFKSLELRGTNVGHERNIIEENGGKPRFFVQEINVTAGVARKRTSGNGVNFNTRTSASVDGIDYKSYHEAYSELGYAEKPYAINHRAELARLGHTVGGPTR